MKYMKYFILLQLVVFFSCAGINVKVDDDPFTKRKKIRAEMWHKPIEGYLVNHKMIYSKEIKNKKISNTKISFEFFAGEYYSGKEFKKYVYILIDDDSFKIPIQNIRIKKEKQYDGVVTYNTLEVHGYTERYLYGDIFLNNIQEQKLINAKSLKMRFFMDEEACTYIATEKQLNAIKEFYKTIQDLQK